MDWQQLAALGIVGVVTGLWVWSRWRRRRQGGCALGCCAGVKPVIVKRPTESR